MALAPAFTIESDQDKLKLALISLLSNPDVKITELSMSQDMEEEPNRDGWIRHVFTGTTHYSLTIYNSKQDGRKKHKKSS